MDKGTLHSIVECFHHQYTYACTPASVWFI